MQIQHINQLKMIVSRLKQISTQLGFYPENLISLFHLSSYFTKFNLKRVQTRKLQYDCTYQNQEL